MDECLRAVFVIVGDQDSAQEIVAEAFDRAGASWRAVSGHPAPAAWVVRTALNVHVSQWRRRRRCRQRVPLAGPAVPATGLCHVRAWDAASSGRWALAVVPSSRS
ncbi:MAG TPA: hypothetical protein VI365_01995 [Trebonia sp.]